MALFLSFFFLEELIIQISRKYIWKWIKYWILINVDWREINMNTQFIFILFKKNNRRFNLVTFAQFPSYILRS